VKEEGLYIPRYLESLPSLLLSKYFYPTFMVKVSRLWISHGTSLVYSDTGRLWDPHTASYNTLLRCRQDTKRYMSTAPDRTQVFLKKLLRDLRTTYPARQGILSDTYLESMSFLCTGSIILGNIRKVKKLSRRTSLFGKSLPSFQRP